MPPNVSHWPGVGTCVLRHAAVVRERVQARIFVRRIGRARQRGRFITLLLLPFQPAPLAPVESAVSNGAAVLTLLLMIELSRLPDVVM